VTIRDVARAAGVSTTTVSDALSGNGRLPAATRERVAAVAVRLGYRANPAARNLRRQRFGGIGLYLPDNAASFTYYLDLAAAAASEALAHGLALTLIPRCPDRFPVKAFPVAAFPVDGIVAVDPVAGDPLVRAFSQLGIPVVTCERDLTPGADHAGCVEGEYRSTMTGLLDHLAGQGAARVALVAPRPQIAWGLELRAAYEAWCAAGSRPSAVYDVPFPCSPEAVRDATVQALRARPAPDAVVSGIDGGAIGALVAAAEIGRRVPEDLLIASCVDSPALRACSPAITALDLQAAEVGRRLAALMHALLEGHLPPGTVQQVPSRLLVRASTRRIAAR
jgi:DNA-binding LacI/PurR family transcriptional regulator